MTIQWETLPSTTKVPSDGCKTGVTFASDNTKLGDSPQLLWDPHHLRDGGPGAGHLATALGINFEKGFVNFEPWWPFVGSSIQRMSPLQPDTEPREPQWFQFVAFAL